MNITDVVAIGIALISLFVSIWVVTRDRRNRRIDLLHQCYDRLHRADSDRPIAALPNATSIGEDEGAPDAEENGGISLRQLAIDRELEFACYLVVAKEIDLQMFFDLFRGWIAARALFWRSKRDHWKARNHPYTVTVIRLCESKGLLPIKHNRALERLARSVDQFLSRDAL